MKHLLILALLSLLACSPSNPHPPALSEYTVPETKSAKESSTVPKTPCYITHPPELDIVDGSYENQITYHGGPVMTRPVNVYLIWYGDWKDGDKRLMEYFVQSLSDSCWYATNTTYYNYAHERVSSKINLVSSISDNYSHGKDLKDFDVINIITDKFSDSGGLVMDTDAVYFVLGSSDVKETFREDFEFCKVYCGYHSYQAISDLGNMKYSFIGDPVSCESSCNPQPDISPNSNSSIDAMANIFAHELSEAVSDPELSAWYMDDSGAESSDICLWNFLDKYKVENGSEANVMLGSKHFLIQSNFVNDDGGYCGLSVNKP